MKREIIEEKIQDLIDGKLSNQEAVMILDEVNKDEYLKMFYTTLKEIDASLQTVTAEEPSAGFTDKVMKGLHKPKTSPFDFRSLYIFIGLIICAAVGLIYASQANLSMPELAPVNTEINVLKGVEINLPGINLPSSEIFLNAFYFGLLFMSLIYFDRVILRQLFRS